MSWDKIGTLRKGEKGNFYLKLDKDVTLKAGQSVQVKDPRKSLVDAVAAGRMSQEKADEMLSKLPDWLRYDLFLTPPPTK